jgi:hypothetical protein
LGWWLAQQALAVGSGLGFHQIVWVLVCLTDRAGNPSGALLLPLLLLLPSEVVLEHCCCGCGDSLGYCVLQAVLVSALFCGVFVRSCCLVSAGGLQGPQEILSLCFKMSCQVSALVVSAHITFGAVLRLPGSPATCRVLCWSHNGSTQLVCFPACGAQLILSHLTACPMTCRVGDLACRCLCRPTLLAAARSAVALPLLSCAAAAAVLCCCRLACHPVAKRQPHTPSGAVLL